MLKHLFFFALAIGVSRTLFAQSPTKITGTVKDKGGAGMLAAYVSVLNPADSQLIKADVTDNEGHYDITLADGGSYLLRYNSLGYETRYAGPLVVAKGNTVPAPPQTLLSSSEQLKEVAIVSKKPLIEVKADKVIFNVEGSINATGSNAMELLRKSPGVVVDNNDNIVMKGKTGVKIYIDGKMSELDAKSLAAYLKSINSSDIESIEMISNPSAKYDASGNAGIVNIKLRKNKKIGTNGNVSATYVQGIHGRESASASLNYRDQKVNIFGNVGGELGTNLNTLNLHRVQMDTIFDQHSSNNGDGRSMNLKAGMDYFVNNKSTLGVLLTTNIGDNTTRSYSYTNIFAPDGTMVRRLDAYNHIPTSRTNNNANLNYRFADTSGHELNVDADYGVYRGRGSSLQPNYYLLPDNSPLYTVVNQNYTPTNIDIYTVKADYEQRLGKGKLGLGGKMSYVKTDNTFDFYNVVNDQPLKELDKSNTFKYLENVNALYANYNRQLSEKVSLQAGLRMENTSSRGELTRADNVAQKDDTVTKNYTDLFPSAALTWAINQKHSLNLTYSRRIDRPSYQDLNPFENKLDELTYEKGNAFLRPQYTNTVELTHTFMGFVNTTAGYSYVHDYATQVTDTLGNANYVQQRNLATQQILSVNLGSPIPVAKICTGYVNLNYNLQMFEGKIGANTVKLNVPSYSVYMMYSITLPKQYTAEVNGVYNGPSVWGGTWRTKPQGGIDVGMQKQFWNKNATLKLSFTDLLKTMPWSADNNFGGMRIHGSGAWESQTARISFSYRFGSSQISEARRRKTGMEDEGNRIKGK